MFAQLINRINRTAPAEADGEGFEPTVVSPLFGADAVTPEQRDLIHLAIDCVDEPMAFFDRHLILQFANAAYCALVDRERHVLVGEAIEAAPPEVLGDDPRGHAQRVLAGESIDLEVPLRDAEAGDGVRRIRYRPQHNAAGFILGVLCVVHRLGRRRADQETAPTGSMGVDAGEVGAPLRAALRIARDDVVERERKQRELIESLPLPLVFIGRDGLCKWGNPAFGTAFGLADHEVGGVVAERLAGLPRQTTRQGLAMATSGQTFSIEQELTLGDAAPRWYRADFLPAFDRDDVQNGVYLLLSDISESRIAKRKLEESEAYFRGYTENIPETVVFLDREWRFRFVNAAFVQRSGRTREELIGRTIDEAFGADLLERSRESLLRAFAGEMFSRSDRSFFAGVDEWYEARYLPIRGEGNDGSGGVQGVYVVSRSLADEKRAERAVRVLDERINFLTDHLPAQIVYLDADLRYRYCNQRFLNDHGIARLEDIVGRTAYDVIGLELAAEAERHGEAALRGEAVSYERCLPSDAGEPRWLAVSMAGDFDADGTARGVYSIAYDITDGKRAEGHRAQQQAVIEAFIENFPQPLSYFDRDGVLRHSNRAYEELARRKWVEAGHPGNAIFGGDIAPLFRPSFERALAGERLHTEHEIGADGSAKRFLAADWMPDLDDDGAVRGVYFVVQDVSEAKQTRIAYEASLREMQQAMDSVALPISFVDAAERLRFVSHTTTEWYGRSAEQMIGTSLSELLSEDDYRFARPYIDAALGGESVQFEREMAYAGGDRRWVLIRYVPTRDARGVVAGFYTTATDIQARKKHEIALQQANGLLTAHFENTPLASFTLDGQGRITRWSSQAETLFGWPRADVIDRSFEEIGLIEPGQALDFLPADGGPDTVAGNTRLHVVEARRRDGSTLTCEWHIASLRDANGAIASSLALIQDVSQRVESERRLTEIAHRDTLTRLLNRNALEPTLRVFIERARQSSTGVAVLFLDLDHFKNINDTLGHRVGDLMLIEVASILRHNVRAEDQVVRIGGDEFMIVIGHRQPKAIAHETAQRILTALGTPIRVDNQRLSVTSSIGIAIYPDHGRAPEALIRSADLAMYRAKENGKNRFEFFSALLAQRSERRSAVKGALKIALQRDALRLWFQPRVQVSDGRIVGAEALLRWEDPRLGVVSPKEFIVIAEESGLIHELGLYVFRRACRQLRDWQDRGIDLGVLSINFSAHQLLVASFITEVDQVVAETGVDPRFIEVEITETSMLFDLGVTRNVIAELKQRGMRIAIDDFGTGFSSLSHLQQLDVDTLKIDQSFIRDMLHDAGDAAITTSVIALARGLGLSTTAEGVENAKQLEVLSAAGCDYYQGFLFSPAIVVKDIEELIIEQQGRTGMPTRH